MSLFDEKDYVQRQIKQLAKAVARAMSLGRGGQLEDAQEGIRAACGEGLGFDLELLAMLDCQRAIAALGSAERVRAYAALLEAQADIEDFANRPEAARAFRVRADELLATLSK
jgi:hypothetical protein